MDQITQTKNRSHLNQIMVKKALTKISQEKILESLCHASLVLDHDQFVSDRMLTEIIGKVRIYCSRID